ncbi:glycosyltransferase family 32 protein [Flavitalea flava]
MVIPKIIHQTWKDKDIPEDFRKMSLTWKKEHEDWEYCLWTDEMNRNFIKQHFSFFLPKYDSYEKNIQRVDALRYFVLYKYGGMFIDLDFECIANITPLVENAQCVFGKEPAEHCLIHQKEIIISNAFMGGVPGHFFLDLLCMELESNRCLTDHPNDLVLESTGPFMLTRVYNSCGRMEDIKILDSDLIYPLTKDELTLVSQGGPIGAALKSKLKKAYGIHYYAGTWWKK